MGCHSGPLREKISTDEGGLSQSPPLSQKSHILLIFSRSGCDGSRLGSRPSRPKGFGRAPAGADLQPQPNGLPGAFSGAPGASRGRLTERPAPTGHAPKASRPTVGAPTTASRAA